MRIHRIKWLAFVGVIIAVYSPLHSLQTPTTFELSNGLKVILAPIENVESACVMMYHLNGTRQDPPSLRGISYLYEILMMMGGTQNLDPFDRVMFTRRYGGDSDGRVNYDNTIFCQVIPDTEINHALWMESERLSSLKLEDQSIDSLKNFIYRRFSRVNQNNISYYASSWVKQKVFEGTIYQAPIYGDLQKLKSIPNNKIKETYSRFQDLSNIILVISGKFNSWEVKDTINKRFGSLPGNSRPSRKKKDILPVKPRTEYLYENRVVEGLTQPFVIYGIRGPAMSDIEYLYFDFIRYYLLDERVSKLEEEIHQKNNLDVAIDYEFTDHHGVNGLLIKLNAKSRIDLEKAKLIVNRQLQLFASPNKFISSGEVKLIRTLMELDFRKNMRDLRKRCKLMAEYYALSGSLDFSQYLQRLNKLTGWSTTRMTKWFKKENLVILNVYGK